MSRHAAITRRVTAGLLLLSVSGLVLGQARGGQAGQIQAAPNPQDQTVKTDAQAAKSDAGGKPLDEQKSAPVQVLTRDYDLNALANEPKVSPSVFRGRVLWVQKCAFCHDGLGQPTYKTLGPWLDQDFVAALTDAGAKILIQNGTAHMPAFKYALSPAQLDDVLDFLKTVPASAKPSPAQLAGKSEGDTSD